MNSEAAIGRPIGWYGYSEQVRADPGFSGISAVLWGLDQKRPVELRAEMPSDTHMVCAHLSGQFDWECQVGSRRYRQPGLPGTCNIASAGEVGRMVMGSAKAEVLHVYLPTALLASCVDDIARRSVATAVELIDPMNASDRHIVQFGNGIARALRAGGPASALEVQGLGMSLAGHLLRAHSNVRDDARPPPSGGLASWQVRRCTELLVAELAREVSLATLAAEVRLSPYHFARAFKKSTGLPPHAYQLGLRVERAKTLLAEGDLSVTEIAMEVGYESSQALARVFQRGVGCSPTAYRRRFR